MTLFLIKTASFKTRRALLNRCRLLLDRLISGFSFRLTARRDSQTLLNTKVLNFLDDFQFVTQWTSKLLNMLIFELQNRFKVLNTIFIEFLAILAQIYRLQELSHLPSVLIFFFLLFSLINSLFNLRRRSKWLLRLITLEFSNKVFTSYCLTLSLDGRFGLCLLFGLCNNVGRW